MACDWQTPTGPLLKSEKGQPGFQVMLVVVSLAGVPGGGKKPPFMGRTPRALVLGGAREPLL